MNKLKGFHIGYWIAALIGVLLIQYAYVSLRQQLATIPYSQFQQLLQDRKVSEVAVSGKVIAEPVFYQRASAMGAAYSFGATDRDMLNRISDLIVSYANRNYPQAVGGPTGLE